MGEVTNRHKAKYQNDNGICEVSIFTYPSKNSLEENIEEDFDLEETSSVGFGNKRTYKKDNSYLWSSEGNVVLIHSQFDYVNKKYDKIDCKNLITGYINNFPSDLTNFPFQSQKNINLSSFDKARLDDEETFSNASSSPTDNEVKNKSDWVSNKVRISSTNKISKEVIDKVEDVRKTLNDKPESMNIKEAKKNNVFQIINDFFEKLKGLF